jgi:hypothetical protein
MGPDKVWEKYASLLGNFSDTSIYQQFLDADPDSKKKNIEWLITCFISGGYKLEELPTMKSTIINFNKLREKGVFQDNLVSFGGLHGFTRNNKVFPSLKSFLEKYNHITTKSVKNVNVVVLTDNNTVKIVQPLNEEASNKYGANTKWCTTGRESRFQRYAYEGGLYIIIPKTPKHDGEKYQIHITYNYIHKYTDIITIFNELDKNITIQDIITNCPYIENNPLIEYVLLRLKGLKMSYKAYIECNGNLEYTIKDGKHELEDGNSYWCLNGLLHREDGPAVEYANGDEAWYKNGLLHREDGPAVFQRAYGAKWWYKNGEFYREDGPAVEWV